MAITAWNINEIQPRLFSRYSTGTFASGMPEEVKHIAADSTAFGFTLVLLSHFHPSAFSVVSMDFKEKKYLSFCFGGPAGQSEQENQPPCVCRVIIGCLYNDSDMQNTRGLFILLPLVCSA